MLVSESWIREWVNPNISTEELAEKLTLAGLEVESITRAGPHLDSTRVVVGEITTVTSHPHAPGLSLCEVRVGNTERLSIVCGAANVRAGLRTTVARAGAKIGDMIISGRDVKGEESEGMLCSAMELGLAESAHGIIEFDQNAPLGAGIADYLDLHDLVFELKLTPNRGDCLGMVGVAREISVLTDTRLEVPAINASQPTISRSLEIRLEAVDACPRYAGRAIQGIDMSARTPDWMVERLRRSGMRSINPIVDISNYVMHELGQPMHAFDLARISGGIVVRRAGEGEELELLDGSTVKLSNSNLVIADHQTAIALAGIMGGNSSAITDNTTDIYLESALFLPDDILGKARQLGMHTDASHRFERGVDSELQLNAIERATGLVLEIAGGRAGPVTDAIERSALPQFRPIRFHQSEIERVLGARVPAKETTRIMRGLGMSVTPTASGWEVIPPGWRFDIQGQHDLVEEVGRCYGFEKIVPTAPSANHQAGRYREGIITQHDIKQVLIQRGYHEAMTYSFVDPASQQNLLDRVDAIVLTNPIADNMAVMRQSLWPGLLEALRNNLNRQESRVRFFEIGHVFNKADNERKSHEENHLAGLISGLCLPSQWGNDSREVDFFDLKGDLEAILNLSVNPDRFQFRRTVNSALHPGQCARIEYEKDVIGHVGRLHPAQQKFYEIDQSVYLFEIDLSILTHSGLPEFSEVSRFPSLQRDLAILVDEEVEVQSVLEIIRASGGELLKKLELFDIYREYKLESNKKSLAVALTFQSESSSLKSSEVEAVTERIIGLLERETGARLRQ